MTKMAGKLFTFDCFSYFMKNHRFLINLKRSQKICVIVQGQHVTQHPTTNNQPASSLVRPSVSSFSKANKEAKVNIEQPRLRRR
jgi:hypothetical protein